jgi:diguanylate cyclase (GGDEF)-like protein
VSPFENAIQRGAHTGHIARLRIVVPIGIVVAVAIACVVIAVLGSAQRADQVALEAERRLFTRALASHSQRVLREVETVVVSEAAYRRIRLDFDSDWVRFFVGQRLQSWFDHDLVFVTDASDHFVYASLAGRGSDPGWFNSIQPDIKPILDHLRSLDTPNAAGALPDRTRLATSSQQRYRLAGVQMFLGRPAIVAVVAVVGDGDPPSDVAGKAPVVISVKWIAADVLDEIASLLQLRNLHMLGEEALASDENMFELTDWRGQPIAKLAWAPKQPGAEIVGSVVPFVAVALAGLALLATLLFRHMRRTSATIAAGETRLRHLALHDPLCGLPNRVSFGERLEETIQKVRGGGSPAAVFYVDLDHFKDVNDTLGHPIGDELIRSVTQRLTSALRGDDLVARIGGDEFGVITSAGRDPTSLQVIANRLIAALCTPYTISDKTIVIGASIGIAVIDENSGDSADVMRHADMALYRAKNEGRNRACIYDIDMDTDLLKRKLVENDLRVAIERNELQVAYQPIVNNSAEKIVGVEALCRWLHPARGEIPPSEFIPIAENSGLIAELGEWVLRHACLDGKSWPDVLIAVNVSPLQFRRADFVDVVERILAETGFDPTRLELEVTESTLLGNVDTAELAMFRLKALGVQLALDDFGTGYSSLLYLRRFPFDKLKIDRSFVLSIERAADAAAIVHAVVSLGRGLGMKVTAEGVETAEQHLFLRAAGVHSMQGFRFGRPGTAAEITARLAQPDSFRIPEDPANPNLALAG